MTIEQLIAANTAALENLTAALNGKAGATNAKASTKGDDDDAPAKPLTAAQKKAAAAKKAAEEGDDDGEPAPKSKPKKITRDDLTAIMNKVKEDLGTPVAKGIISKVGAERLAEIEDEDIEEAYNLAKAKLDKAAKDGADSGDDI